MGGGRQDASPASEGTAAAVQTPVTVEKAFADAGDMVQSCIVTPRHAPSKAKLPLAPGSKPGIQTGGGRTAGAKTKTVAELCEGAEEM